MLEGRDVVAALCVCRRWRRVLHDGGQARCMLAEGAEAAARAKMARRAAVDRHYMDEFGSGSGSEYGYDSMASGEGEDWHGMGPHPFFIDDGYNLPGWL